MATSTNKSAVLFAYGFRPFFLVGSGWSLLMLAIWLLVLEGTLSWQSKLALPLWHAHEMLYGFVAASAAGFLLTASPNWSRKPALQGKPLQWLLLFWLLGRLAVTANPWLSEWLVAVADMLFPVALIVATGPTLWFTGNKVHRIFPLLLLIMAMGNILFHGQAVGLLDNSARSGLYVGIDAIVFFLIMVGGHIMPMFTRNALAANEILPPFPIKPWLEIAGAVSMGAIVISDWIDPYSSLGGGLLILASIVQGWRLSMWHSLKTLKIPILWVLHIGYGWLVLGLFLRGLAQLGYLLPPSTALHALTIGAMGLFTIGIMSRVSLAHTGRGLVASTSLVMAFYCILTAALVRVFASLLWPAESLFLSGLLWLLAFILFLYQFTSILLQPRADGLPG
ncbi:MAG: NnrS family protein [Magnetococcales bacterium]|nr:NnrS family protein [Magnetococcales bacterium]